MGVTDLEIFTLLKIKINKIDSEQARMKNYYSSLSVVFTKTLCGLSTT